MPIANVYNDEGGTGTEINADSANKLKNDDFTSLCNGSNTQFTTTKDVVSGSLMVFLNGLKQRASQVSIIDERNFEFSTPPLSGDVLEAVYNTSTE